MIVAIVLKVGAGRALRTYGKTVNELRWAILTVAAVLALAYVMNASAQTTAIGLFVAGAGAALAFLSPVLGWFAVAVTGSDTSANALFGSLQVTAAQGAGLPPELLAGGELVRRGAAARCSRRRTSPSPRRGEAGGPGGRAAAQGDRLEPGPCCSCWPR